MKQNLKEEVELLLSKSPMIPSMDDLEYEEKLINARNRFLALEEKIVLGQNILSDVIYL